MTQFSRRARWLNSLFPASKSPQVSDPGSRSDDVSLVQPYDAGGYLAERRQWFIQADSPVGISGSTILLENDEETIFRLFGFSAFRLVGIGAPRMNLVVADLISVPNVAVVLTPIENVNALGFPAIVPVLRQPIVIGPGSTLRADHIDGDVTTGIRYLVYGCAAPLGSVFYC